MEENNVIYESVPEEPVPVESRQEFDPTGLNPWQRLNCFCSDGKFLAVCVLFSVNVACSIFGWLSFSLPVINILLTIFLWMAFAAAKKNRIYPKDVKKISGTVFALEIVKYVEALFAILVGFLCMAFFGFLSSEGFAGMFLKKKSEIQQYLKIIQPLMSMFATVTMVILVICAIVTVILAFLGIGAVHRFVKTAYTSAATGVLEIKSRKGASGWLIAFAVLNGMNAVSIIFYITGAVQYGVLCAAYILLSQLIRKYYGDC